MPDERGEYITLKEAARLAGYRDASTLHMAVRTGRLKAVKPEGSILLTTGAWLADYRASLRSGGYVGQHRATEE